MDKQENNMCFEPENVQVSYMHFQDGLIKFSFLLSTLMGNLFLDGTSSEGGSSHIAL
jgi:hypothetical protein